MMNLYKKGKFGRNLLIALVFIPLLFVIIGLFIASCLMGVTWIQAFYFEKSTLFWVFWFVGSLLSLAFWWAKWMNAEIEKA